MATTEFLDLDPRSLHLPSSRQAGADPVKLHDQMRRFGSNVAGMPPIQVLRGSDGALIIFDGVTRATRVAKLFPGSSIRLEVIETLRKPFGHFRKLGDLLP